MSRRKSIGILTTHYAINYGAALQAHALQFYLNKQGFNAEVINYRPENMVDGRNIVFKTGSLKALIYSLLELSNLSFRKARVEKIRRFESFVESAMPLSGSLLQRNSEVNRIVANYDALICGSDQIWNPSLFSDTCYFLQFADKSKKLIAYAPSVAESLDNKQWQELSDNVGHIDCLSVREGSAAVELQGILKRNVATVLDPTLLLDQTDWQTIEAVVDVPKQYLLSYQLVSNGAFPRATKSLKELTGMLLVDINLRPFVRREADISLRNMGPREYLYLFRNASHICTSSFHGTVFAIIFGRQFVTLPAPSRDSRVRNLLKLTGLSDRLLDESMSSSQIRRILETPIDYASVRVRLADAVATSRKYLGTALKT